MNPIYTAELKLAKHLSKKNSRPIYKRGKGHFLGKSAQLHLIEKYMTQMFMVAAVKQGIKEPLDCRLHIKLTFLFENKKSFILCDLSNLYELPQDCLQEAGVIKSDRLVFSHDGSRKILGTETVLKVEIFNYTD